MRRHISRQSIAIGIAAVTVALLFAASAAADTWSGTWSRAEDGVAGEMVLVQSGATVTGQYTWHGTGRVSGTVTGATFAGAFTETHYQGSFTLALAGTTFSGTYAGTNRDSGGPVSGPFDAVCVAGPCLGNAAAPAQLPAARGWGETVVGPPISPGTTALVESPPIGAGQQEADLTIGPGACGAAAEGRARSAAGYMCNLSGLELVMSSLSKRDRLLTCVGIFAFSIEHEVTSSFGGMFGTPVITTTTKEGDNALAVLAARACMEVYRSLEAQGRSRDAAAAASGGCGSAFLALTFATDRTHRTARVRPKGRGRLGQAGPLLASCSYGPGGITLRVRPRARGATLRSLVGPRLVVGVYRSRRTTGRASFTATFGRR